MLNDKIKGKRKKVYILHFLLILVYVLFSLLADWLERRTGEHKHLSVIHLEPLLEEIKINDMLGLVGFYYVYSSENVREEVKETPEKVRGCIEVFSIPKLLESDVSSYEHYIESVTPVTRIEFQRESIDINNNIFSSVPVAFIQLN